MSYIILKAKVGFIVMPSFSRGEYSEPTQYAAFDTWEQAAQWIGERFKEAK